MTLQSLYTAMKSDRNRDGAAAVRPVCVVGMHRSGTSLVTQLLHSCGLYLGHDDDLMPPGPDNAAGFWENTKFVGINDEVLNALGGGWDCPPPPPDNWTTDRRLQRRASVLLRQFLGRGPWGWKDPRTSLTLPFWKGCCPNSREVVCLRNPLEVALSLHERNGVSYALGLNL